MDAALPDNYPNGISGPPIDDKAVQYVGSQGLCLEDAKPNERTTRSRVRACGMVSDGTTGLAEEVSGTNR
jgi:hypothetical protein